MRYLLFLLIEAILVSFSLVLLRQPLIFAAQNIITIDSTNEIGYFNRNVLGNNLLGFDPANHNKGTRHYYGHADYGAGIWNPRHNNAKPEVIALAREAGVTVLRFPGGCGSHQYDWKLTVGKWRQHFLFGIDEFLRVCQQIGAEPVFTVSYFMGNELDAADLVEYLNSSNNGFNINGGIDWAKERANNGHPEPYNVRFFEIGNEVYHGNHLDIKKLTPKEYGKEYLKYYFAMKNIDPQIKIGVVLYNEQWNNELLETIHANFDFGIIHAYPAAGIKEGAGLDINFKEFFKLLYINAYLYNETSFQNVLSAFLKITGSIKPLAITEFNGYFTPRKFGVYRHSLGGALLNAEILQILLKPNNKILIANYWNFINEYWGMISNGFRGNEKGFDHQYYKRPNFYVSKLFKEHSGDIILGVDVKTDSYDMNEYKIVRYFSRKAINGDGNLPFLSITASKSKDNNTLYLCVLNVNIEEPTKTIINIKGFPPKSISEYWTLNGPDLSADNELKHDNVKITHKTFKIVPLSQTDHSDESFSFEYTFEPHSLTAIEIERAK